MFTQGFEKTASYKTVEHAVRGATEAVKKIPRNISPSTIAGKALGTAVRAPQEVAKKISEFAKKRSKKFTEGYEKSVRPKSAQNPVGAGLAKAQEHKYLKQRRKNAELSLKHNPVVSGRAAISYKERKEMLPEAAKGAVRARHEKMKAGSKERAKGPSFATTHPFITAGAGLIAGKAMFGAKPGEEQSPQIQYPQY